MFRISEIHGTQRYFPHHDEQANVLSEQLSLFMRKVRYNPFTQGILLSAAVLLLGGLIYAAQFLAFETGHHVASSLSFRPAKQEFKQLARLSDLKKEFILKPYSGEIQFSAYHPSNPEERWRNWTQWERAVQSCISPNSPYVGLRSESSSHPDTNLPVFWLTRGWMIVSQLMPRAVLPPLSDQPG